MTCLVALCSPPYASLTYLVPDHLQCISWRRGLRVAVPLGGGALRAGVVLETGGSAGEGLVLKPVAWPLEREPLLPADYMDTVMQLAVRQCAEPGRILGALLPQGLRVTARVRIRRYAGPSGAGRAAGQRLTALRDLPSLSGDELGALAEDFAAGRADVLMPAEDAAASELCVLACEPPWPVRPAAVRQRAILDWLLAHGAATGRSLRDALPECGPALERLAKAGLVRMQPSGADDGDAREMELLPPPEPPFRLSDAQQAAVDDCCRAMDALAAGEKEPFARLLYGVTGSGKTAVYLEIARACLARGRSALLLAPEVAIALKLKRDAEQRFPGIPVVFYHGYQGRVLRERTFCSLAARRDPCLVVGTRSALFLPFPRLGAVVLDEEHDASFKQEDRLPYHAKEVAWERAARHGALLVLGSATPDVKTFHAVRKGAFPMLRLPARVGGGTLPEVEFVDIRNQPASRLLAPRSLEALRGTVRRGEQAVILLNRRGYAPLMYCLDCGAAMRCPNCDISLTYHKRREQLVCHYCGHAAPYPSPCAKCGGTNLLPMGQGTEKLEESLASGGLDGILPPGGKVLRLDRDSTARQGRMEEILASFARQEAQILVGTQMLSKGHHFPNVTLALVADGDMGLNLPDYRSAERTFQLLVQASGRAGRGEKPGRVLIQTRDPGHYCWEFVRTGDYEGFYEREIALREKRGYPPFVKLALVRMSFPAEDPEGPAFASAFASALKKAGRMCGLSVLGPAPAPLARIQGRTRLQCLVKSPDWPGVRRAYGAALKEAGPLHGGCRVSLDLDPVNML